MFASAILAVVQQVDAELSHPARLDVVDVGAGRGELLTSLLGQAPPELRARLRCVAVELRSRPPELPPVIDWQPDIPELRGLLIAHEWLDNVPLDVGVAAAGGVRYLEVDPATGAERAGAPLQPVDAAWQRRWWPVRRDGRVELGPSRDAAWAEVIGRITAGTALAIDYGHLHHDRPNRTLAGFRDGRSCPPVPDGRYDVSAAVAMDALAAAGEQAGAVTVTLQQQRAALHGLGLHGRRPALGGADYAAALQRASEIATLTDPAGLGGFWWLQQRVRMQR